MQGNSGKSFYSSLSFSLFLSLSLSVCLFVCMYVCMCLWKLFTYIHIYDCKVDGTYFSISLFCPCVVRLSLIFQVGRPNNAPNAVTMVEDLRKEARKCHRIYVASIHPSLTESDLRMVFDPFGGIRLCKLIPNPEVRECVSMHVYVCLVEKETEVHSKRIVGFVGSA